VLTLIARGLSNGEIAQTLTLSEGTVKTHINRILAKLDLHDRIQAVILGYQTGLVTPSHQPRTPTQGPAPRYDHPDRLR